MNMVRIKLQSNYYIGRKYDNTLWAVPYLESGCLFTKREAVNYMKKFPAYKYELV